MRVRLFGHYWHTPLLLLWLAESGVVVLSYSLVEEAGTQHPAALVRTATFSTAVILTMVALGLFSRRQRDRMAGILLRVGLSVVAGGTLSIVLFALVNALSPARPLAVLAAAMIAATALVAVRAIASRLMDEEVFKRRVLVLGAGRNAAKIAQLRRRADRLGVSFVGFIPVTDEPLAVSPERLVTLRGSLADHVRTLDVDEIVVAMDDRRRNFPIDDLLRCRLAGVEISELITFLERETGKVHLDILNPSWMIFGEGFRSDALRRHSERVFDVVASLIIIVVTSPIMVLTALAITVEDGLRSPILYSQTRVGQFGRHFNVLKFRSMRIDAEQDGRAQWAQINDSRVTRVGSFIRKTRIDELPQLLNVLKGDMSFVGPRPERPQFVAELAASIPYYSERHTVKPGITGWAQLCYRYGSSAQDALEKLQYDLYYVKNHGLFFDLLILLQTVEVVLLSKGAR